MCTIFAKCEEEGLIVGRSFDWVQFGGNICFEPSYRSYGVNTIGHCSIEQLGIDRPYEGINEKGLLAAALALSTTKEEQGELTPLVINCQGMLKYILERAGTVDEAFYIIKQFTLDYERKYGFPKIQFFFADTDNKVGIYEENIYEENVTLDVGEYRMLTNQSATDSLRYSRDKKIKNILDENRKIDTDYCMDIVSQAKQEELTAWSSVYIPRDKMFFLCIDQNFDKKYKFDLEKCLKKGRYSIDFAELKLNAKVMGRKRNKGFVELDTY
ncbi:MAG: hypothetical protein M0P14_02030 [Alkaliphilus sp.]|nr:hypothetical protein [Alkaliphilus sp.]